MFIFVFFFVCVMEEEDRNVCQGLPKNLYITLYKCGIRVGLTPLEEAAAARKAAHAQN